MACGSAKSFWMEFFEIFRDHKELWKVKSEKYKDKNERLKGYDILLKKYQEKDENATIDTLKKKINTIRTNYRRVLKKVKMSEKSGAASKDIYTPSLWYFDQLHYLRDQETPDVGISTLDIEEGEDAPEDSLEAESTQVTPSRPKKQKLSNERNEFLKKAVKYLDTLNDVAEMLGKVWASQYRKLSVEQQLYAKKHIDDILYHGRLSKLGPSPTPSITPLLFVSSSSYDSSSTTTSYMYEPMQIPCYTDISSLLSNTQYH
ncbi:uncharacterized protein [Onthophagus taurus]|uniref:uncharacterized protein n=1 Tax=Onthophagus taurus TaxID=166361 RepID=UPI0039BE3B7C